MDMYKELAITEPVAKGIQDAYEINDNVAMAMCVSTFWTKAVRYITKTLEEYGMLLKFSEKNERMDWTFTEGGKHYAFTYDGFKNELTTQLLAWGKNENGIKLALDTIINRMVQ